MRENEFERRKEYCDFHLVLQNSPRKKSIYETF